MNEEMIDGETKSFFVKEQLLTVMKQVTAICK